MARPRTGNQFSLKIYLSRQNLIDLGIVDEIASLMKAKHSRGRSAAARQILTVGWLALQGSDVRRIARELKVGEWVSTQQLLEALRSSPRDTASKQHNVEFAVTAETPLPEGERPENRSLDRAAADLPMTRMPEPQPCTAPDAGALKLLKLGRNFRQHS